MSKPPPPPPFDGKDEDDLDDADDDADDDDDLLERELPPSAMSYQRLPNLHQSRRITWGNPYSSATASDKEADVSPPHSPHVDLPDQLLHNPTATPTGVADPDMASSINY